MIDPVPGDLSLSTVWASAGRRLHEEPFSAEAFLDLLQECGYSRLELEYRLPSAMLAEMLPGLGPRGLGVSSIHNFCPFPPELDGLKPSGDLFNLAASDPEELGRAVEYTTRTLELANELETSAVVIHLGWVEGLDERGLTREAAKQGAMTPALADNLAERTKLAQPHLDAASFALEKLIKRAEPLGVTMGLENRLHGFQIPSLDETDMLVRRFGGAPLGAWYDLGHAVMQELAGIGPAKAWLDRLGGQLVGCHLHDVDAGEDHRAPGTGDLDWEQVCADLAACPIKVLEVGAGPSAMEMNQAGHRLAKLFAGAAKDPAGEGTE